MSTQKLWLIFVVLVCLMLACTSVSQFVGMPDPNDPGFNPKDEEDDSIGADIERRANATYTAEAQALETEEPSQNTNAFELTPEEELNRGQHFYVIEGIGTALLGGDGTYSGEGFATSDFFEGGVIFHLSEQPSELYNKVGFNTYEFKNENVSITLIYTVSGFEYHSIGDIELHYYGEGSLEVGAV